VANALVTYRANLLQAAYIASSKQPPEPYRYLDFFTLAETKLFEGRKIARAEVRERIMANQTSHRLMLLHAPSGVGKTSLLRAGLIPDLLAEGFLPIYVEARQEPVKAIKSTISPDAPYPRLLDDLPLNTYLTWVVSGLAHNESLLIILDQFEQFFIFAQPQEPIKIGLARSLQDERLPVQFILSIRKDYFSDLAVFESVLPDIFRNHYLLKPLTRQEAAQAITNPVKSFAAKWENKSVETLLDYLDQGEIESPHLQLICSRLYEAAKKEGKTTITIEGVDLKAIHANYLLEEMEAPGLDATLGWRLLKRLVTPEGTRRPLSLEDLYREVAPQGELEPVLMRLVNRRLLRRDENNRQTIIQVAHDTLAAEIASTETDHERKEKVAREMIDRGMANWNHLKQLMSMVELAALDNYHQHLANINKKALELLLRSALATGHKVLTWFEHAQAGGVDVGSILSERLKSDNFRERVWAANLLAELKGPFVELLKSALEDPYPQVRAAAILALEKLQPTGEWRRALIDECYVPAGRFVMGDDRILPLQEVELDAFYIGKYPVTNRAYQLYMASTEQNFTFPDGEDLHPVVNISWHDANKYAKWAGMRLLTEAEWEKAASWDLGDGSNPPTKRKYPWGNEFDSQRCNTFESSKIGLGGKATTVVNRYSPRGDSPFGVADMAGNMWEWCHDFYVANHSSEGTSWRYSASGEQPADVESEHETVSVFFAAPLQDTNPSVLTTSTPAEVEPLSGRLLRVLMDAFSLGELQDLFWDLKIPYERVPGKSKFSKASQLVSHFYKQNSISTLVDMIKKLRPHRLLEIPDEQIEADKHLVLVEMGLTEFLREAVNHIFSNNFNENEFLGLAHTFYPNYDYLLTMGYQDRITELVAYLEIHGRANELIREIERLRPRLLSEILAKDENVVILPSRTVDSPETGSEQFSALTLVKILVIAFNNKELEELCRVLGVDVENLPGETRPDRAREIVAYFSRHNRIPALLKAIYQAWPHIAWWNTPDKLQAALFAAYAPTKLYGVLNNYFDKSSLFSLCFYLGIDHESLPGTTKADLIRSLLFLLQQQNRLADLANLINKEKPSVSWSDTPEVNRFLFAQIIDTSRLGTDLRVLRGGSCEDISLAATCTSRSGSLADVCHATVGFRVGFSAK
jgi:formylglycine-generating enzyme required for sulfatase activity